MTEENTQIIRKRSHGKIKGTTSKSQTKESLTRSLMLIVRLKIFRSNLIMVELKKNYSLSRTRQEIWPHVTTTSIE